MAIRIHFYGNVIRFELIYLRPPTFYSLRAQHKRLQLWATERNPQFPIIRRCTMSVVVFDGQNTKNGFSFTYKLLTTVRVCRILSNFFFPLFSIFFF